MFFFFPCNLLVLIFICLVTEKLAENCEGKLLQCDFCRHELNGVYQKLDWEIRLNLIC